jgi:thiol-disulfide isomerase/thioredoxin
MSRHLPRWLSALLLIAGSLGVFWVIGKTQTSSPGAAASADDPGASLADKQISAPDFSGPALDGKEFRLSGHKGEVVLVNFWATWCGPCRMEIPDFIKLQEKYAGRGFTIIGLAQDDEAKVRAYVEQSGINYPVVIDKGETGQQYGVTGLPSSILVDRKGKVVYAMQGAAASGMEELWSEQIEKVL